MREKGEMYGGKARSNYTKSNSDIDDRLKHTEFSIIFFFPLVEFRARLWL